ncbi:MAG TPA: hypothetical protein VK932_10520, partial [Kofleriaceae bacterium]|nr:hypothetical protein [Kofleriaceae bacterium]
MDRPKTPSKPPTGKPFLGDDDLLNELDAWDATFDALHGGPEEGGGRGALGGGGEPGEGDLGVELGEAAAASDELADPTVMIGADLRGLDRLASEFDEPVHEPDEDLSIEGGLEDPAFDHGGAPPRRATSATSVDTAHLEDPLEADFSDLAPQPDAGRSTRRTMPPPIGDEDGPQISRPRARPPSDDGIYTSASRPNPPPARPYDDEDALAPPPPPAPEPPRRGPAIVRRTLSHAIVRDESQVTPSHGTDLALFAERTRLTAPDEIEPAVVASREVSSAPTLDEEAYDDIEIGAEAGGPGAGSGVPAALSSTAGSGSAPLPVTDAFSAGRRTAHVLRRETGTRPPAITPRPAPVIGPVAAADDRSGPGRAARPSQELAAEDDFSDVAAAVGAEGDVDSAFDPGLGAPVPRPGSPSGVHERPPTFELDLDDDEPPPPAHADDPERGVFAAALDDLDDGPPPRSSPHAAPPPPAAEPAHLPPRPLPGPPMFSETRKGIPALVMPARPAPGQPPALVDIYPPRVKTPTSVPPLGGAPAFPARADAPGPRRPPASPEVEGGPDAEGELEPTLDLEAAGRAWPEQVAPLPSAAIDEACAGSLLIYEREVATLDESVASAALRVEAGRLCERLADLERARTHYDAALLADPRATAALRGLRRIARAAGDLVEATRLLDSEIAVAGALERRPLGHYRIDLLMASGEQDLARVAVGELLDTAPSDVRALLAQLELAFLDGRADEFGASLEQLAHAVTDPELRAAAQVVRGALAAQQHDNAAAMGWFTAAAAADPGALAARLGAVRYAAAQ